MFNILSNSNLELLSVLTLLLSVWYASINDKKTWVYSFISQVFSVILYQRTNHYFMMALQYFYIGTSIYGYYFWKITDTFNKSNINILIGIFSILFWFLFPEKIELIISLLSVYATILLIKRYYETWFLWLIINILTVYFNIINDFKYLTILYIILAVIAFKSYFNWKKLYEKRINIR